MFPSEGTFCLERCFGWFCYSKKGSLHWPVGLRTSAVAHKALRDSLMPHGKHRLPFQKAFGADFPPIFSEHLGLKPLLWSPGVYSLTQKQNKKWKIALKIAFVQLTNSTPNSLKMFVFPRDFKRQNASELWRNDFVSEGRSFQTVNRNPRTTWQRCATFVLNTTKRNTRLPKRDRINNPRHGQHPERDRNEIQVCIVSGHEGTRQGSMPV